jgi:hypothetical protein
MNQWWGPPGDDDDGSQDGYDAWFDVWVEEDGSLGSYLGQRTSDLAAADLKEAMREALRDLLLGRARRVRHSRNPSGVIDLEQAVLLIRVVHQRNGQVSCGWGRFAQEDGLLRPLRELAAIASEMLPAHPVSHV